MFPWQPSLKVERDDHIPGIEGHMWAITPRCKPQHRAHAGSSATTSVHDKNIVAILKLSLKILCHSKIDVTMFKI